MYTTNTIGTSTAVRRCAKIYSREQTNSQGLQPVGDCQTANLWLELQDICRPPPSCEKLPGSSRPVLEVSSFSPAYPRLGQALN